MSNAHGTTIKVSTPQNQYWWQAKLIVCEVECVCGAKFGITTWVKLAAVHLPKFACSKCQAAAPTTAMEALAEVIMKDIRKAERN